MPQVTAFPPIGAGRACASRWFLIFLELVVKWPGHSSLACRLAVGAFFPVSAGGGCASGAL